MNKLWTYAVSFIISLYLVFLIGLKAFDVTWLKINPIKSNTSLVSFTSHVRARDCKCQDLAAG